MKGLEKLIKENNDRIEKLNDDLEVYKSKLKGLTFEEYEIELYIITIAEQMKKARDEIYTLRYENWKLKRTMREGD